MQQRPASDPALQMVRGMRLLAPVILELTAIYGGWSLAVVTSVIALALPPVEPGGTWEIAAAICYVIGCVGVLVPRRRRGRLVLVWLACYATPLVWLGACRPTEVGLQGILVGIFLTWVSRWSWVLRAIPWFGRRAWQRLA